MRQKLSELYKEERENICKNIINILDLDSNQCLYSFFIRANRTTVCKYIFRS